MKTMKTYHFSLHLSSLNVDGLLNGEMDTGPGAQALRGPWCS